MGENIYQRPKALLQDNQTPEALITHVKKPKIVWVIVAWIFLCLGIVFRGIFSQLLEPLSLDEQTAKQLSLLPMFMVVFLMVGVRKLHKISCYIAGGVFILFSLFQIISLAFFFTEYGIKSSILAVVIYVIPSALCSYWLLKPSSRELYTRYSAYKYNESMKKIATKRLYR
ncbi:hypothetical protein [Zooshikella ganghwensis]|uniref:Uncharacterized protein n=1 Tax=Zooshikella ganghwensis TaxID=202772 RepID=A0A4P9VKE2_9GAMM|nr:hypothetical protein [Zooshikella ganghwensis]RDH43723.1 hypothetical protein B9G39_09870 [Zooshikella ganghwensis]